MFENDKNNYYLGNPKLKKANVQLAYSDEQLSELGLVSQNIDHFCQNYVKITSIDEGLINFQAYPYQYKICLLYTSPSPRDKRQSRMPSSA